MDSFWNEPKVPLALLFVAFLVTFLITRTITRLIRAGKGPFRNNIQGGVHIHHAVPGLILLLIGAVTSVAAAGHAPGSLIAAVLIGVGASLVLDEFALILHLTDVYWTKEGQLSVQVVSLTVALLGLLALGIDPFTEDDLSAVGHLGLLVVLPVHIACVLVCVAKGKYSTAAVAAFIPPVGWIGAVRLARPGSRWARRHYSDAKKQRARDRASAFDARFGRWGLDVEDLVAGKPTMGE
ncbi:hypothetical protein ABLE92_24535 [Gordonia sp. VNQ95]|uniref:hypothetical protein n=1 Tax=Gordonia sp. VNQ95 TaxID=3156619 RepID=UPI0032B46A76